MPSYIITCPVCRKQYKLTPKDPALLAQRSFECPNCSYSAPFTALIIDLPTKQPDTRQNPVVNDGGETKVYHSNQLSRDYFTVMGGSRLVLSPGSYIVGRKSTDSQSTLQLAPDIHMSRQHARLVVQLVNGRLMAQIVGLKTNNPVFVNNKPLPVGKAYTLRNGDRLQIGMTYVLFSLQ